MTKLYIIRHGETVWNAETRAQGAKNIQLNEKGLLQAQHLGKRMKNYSIDAIYSSDLDRALSTAQAVAKEFQYKVNIIPELREMSFGHWEGLTNREIQEKHLTHYRIWRSKPHEAQIPGAEKLLDVQSRGLAALHRIVEENPNKNVAVVSHGTAIKAILLGLMDMDLSNFYRIRQDNACINVVEFREYGPVIVTMNDTAHLENTL
ncbi:histidine phosphatase family protein [Geosporobacter ferrireducens]|uniref:Phosphoglycerate mutase n=1 Tax=Geosporobacter ferrireducens TaxID=1424294 RepID=A0A1D8GB12_9FIRM|nr:histidine phosphatase family protein [Geosporobacter ferrireducens]AOT68107.1 hypothetical protein Gferi_00045 [Geosporobacter ferrireducens]AOT73346.1 hypothetical protein Gferi_27320 [Geosporobacter ferrireducens]MTI55342.1 histidine phosphatase family protein [Geosporobacter ferrireducens]